MNPLIYSVLKPATNSDSASDKSKGTLFDSAKKAIKAKINQQKLKNTIGKPLKFHGKCRNVKYSITDQETEQKSINTTIVLSISSNETSELISLIQPNIEYLLQPEKADKIRNNIVRADNKSTSNQLNHTSIKKNGKTSKKHPKEKPKKKERKDMKP